MPVADLFPPSMSVSHLWPWIGLVLAVPLAIALAGGGLRGDRSVTRWRDPVWLCWAGTLAYLFHQVEEHGVDALGVPYAFRGMLCATFGFPDPAACPIPEAFITAVNIPVVWLAGPVCALLGRQRPALALAWLGVPAVNTMAHLVPAVVEGAYNPGLVTALVLFLPLSAWSFRVALGRPDLGRRAVAGTVAGGVLLHAVLMGSLLAFLAGRIGTALLVLIQIVNPVIPPALVARVTAGRQISPPPARPRPGSR
ncbi:HXXEE domain-containing protein [Tistrella mobilis]|uniref:HXXEE domain-containing protein n=1 Tax=Tistrella mobilis TaxID=171437 RepID=A0A162JJX5_9PROT|nr:HXXEE domain-containing protein [Tistrella mobilis]KYO49347.1 hypothetical protein AUP44_18300 [Tistrella mobilis]